jgi:DNA polymerase III subunit epsilon
MPVGMKLPVLPVYYYHDHFTEMLFFVSETYGPVLTKRHRAFVETFKTLSKDAQCLLIRMINRRGRLFRYGAFRYAEIADARSALEELRNCNLVRALVEGDYVDFILCHAKEALIKGGKDAGLTDIRTSWSKAKNVTFKTAHDYCGGVSSSRWAIQSLSSSCCTFISGRRRMISRISRCEISASSEPTRTQT